MILPAPGVGTVRVTGGELVVTEDSDRGVYIVFLPDSVTARPIAIGRFERDPMRRGDKAFPIRPSPAFAELHRERMRSEVARLQALRDARAPSVYVDHGEDPEW